MTTYDICHYCQWFIHFNQVKLTCNNVRATLTCLFVFVMDNVLIRHTRYTIKHQTGYYWTLWGSSSLHVMLFKASNNTDYNLYKYDQIMSTDTTILNNSL